MIPQLKSAAFVILLGALQLALLAVLHDGCLLAARTFGRGIRTDIQFGLTLHYSLWLFGVLAFAIPSSLILVRSRGLAAILFLVFLMLWSWLVLPSLPYHPLHASMFFLIGLVPIVGSTWLASRMIATPAKEIP
jgi:hypothetical protein